VTKTRARKGIKLSEVRTVRSITDNLPEDLRAKAKEVFEVVQSNWKSYLNKDTAFRQSRSDLAAALVEARKLLDEAGKKQLFHRFLEARGIPRSTAYDLIKDYERAAAAPEVLKKAAEQEGLDLTAKRHADQLQQVIECDEPMSEQKAVELVSGWKKETKPAACPLSPPRI
jgi:hypothetical protein